MSRVFVPVSGKSDIDRENILSDLRGSGAKRVFIAFDDRWPFRRGELRKKYISEIKKAVDFYTENGFETGVWITTLGFGSPHVSYNEEAAKKFTPIMNIFGKEEKDAFCPLDAEFCRTVCDFVEDLCRGSGLRILMLDDELCLSARHGIGCACELHMAEYRKRLGEPIAREEIGKKAFCGKANRYRDVWFSLMHDTLVDFCRMIREAIDRVDPSIRAGFCAGYTSWDLEGADALELTEILAGKNEPFLRFTGAPYWYANGRFKNMSLATIIETARLQYALCEGKGIEVFTEVDTYPRDRYHVPAAYAELLDLGCMASDDMDALKYMYAYSCGGEFERGYVNAHMEHLGLYEKIKEAFAGKEPAGVRVYESIKKIQKADLPSPEMFSEEDGRRVCRMSFPLTQTVFSPNAIPTVYKGAGLCGAAFGENARYLPAGAAKKGLILDTKAALILAEKGIDTGIVSARRIPCAANEKYLESGVVNPLYDSSYVYRLRLKDGACVKSSFVARELFDEWETPAAYTYENANGERFLVFAFSAEELRESSTLLRSYERGRQIADAMEWLGGKPLDARCDGHPMLCSIQKKGAEGLAAAYLNCHADEIKDAKIILGAPAKTVRFINCTGRQTDEKTLVIDRIPAYGFAAFEAK